ncbi:MAG: hypothetical protein JXA96_00840 [Sedimentisphaerales bacterium]|nr:hypothetical protein [Sedimentisphaerales bacterium]
MQKEILDQLASAALDKTPVNGYTHNFYRYPARFSPTFASTAINLFSKRGDIVLDPYMGGGTTIIEGMLQGRRVIGIDLNSLAVFITKVKTTKLTPSEKKIILNWVKEVIPILKYNKTVKKIIDDLTDKRLKNMNFPKAKFIKKIINEALILIDNLPSQNARNFVRCAILKTTQWALDGRRSHVSLQQYRYKLHENIYKMLYKLDEFILTLDTQYNQFPNCDLYESNAEQIDKIPFFTSDNKVDLVVTSPPYPGLHILYHRWQINGRRETPAPYWISDCQDGQGDSYYNFGSRHQPNHDSYFETSLKTLQAIRQVMRSNAYIIQLIAFSNPYSHLPRYLANMELAGFTEVKKNSYKEFSDSMRIWRDVPNRKWHANLKGKTSGSKEVVLIHRAE